MIARRTSEKEALDSCLCDCFCRLKCSHCGVLSFDDASRPLSGRKMSRDLESFSKFEFNLPKNEILSFDVGSDLFCNINTDVFDIIIKSKNQIGLFSNDCGSLCFLDVCPQPI